MKFIDFITESEGVISWFDVAKALQAAGYLGPKKITMNPTISKEHLAMEVIFPWKMLGPILADHGLIERGTTVTFEAGKGGLKIHKK